MPDPISADKDVLDLIIQVLVVVIPVLLTWFVRTYVKGSRAERDIAAIVRLSNTAIDYVENLDKRGELNLPPDVSKGAYKLKVAGDWLENELERAGINMTDEEAQDWIAAEFQKRVGDVRMVSTIGELARDAVDTVFRLEQDGVVDFPSDIERYVFLTGLAADWIVAELARRGGRISHDEALVWARAELTERLSRDHGRDHGRSPEPIPSPTDLHALARDAVAFARASGVAAQGMETDLATAWLLTEATRRGLVVSSEEIVAAIGAALRPPA